MGFAPRLVAPHIAEMPRTESARLRVLAADDSAVDLVLLGSLLSSWGYDVLKVVDGNAAWAALNEPEAPHLAILDWEMPGLTGPEICRRVRAAADRAQPHLILLTSKETKEDLVHGLAAGADDYLTKPFHPSELQARVRVGERILELRDRLADRVGDLEKALAEVHQLRGIIPICMYCKRVRDDTDFWQQVEIYITDHSEARFSHGICPECFEREANAPLEGV